MDKTLAILKALLGTIGDVTLSEAMTWLEVKDNAEHLLKEGHLGDIGEDSKPEKASSL